MGKRRVLLVAVVACVISVVVLFVVLDDGAKTSPAEQTKAAARSEISTIEAWVAECSTGRSVLFTIWALQKPGDPTPPLAIPTDEVSAAATCAATAPIP